MVKVPLAPPPAPLRLVLAPGAMWSPPIGLLTSRHGEVPPAPLASLLRHTLPLPNPSTPLPSAPFPKPALPRASASSLSWQAHAAAGAAAAAAARLGGGGRRRGGRRGGR